MLVARETLASIPTFDSLLLNRVAVLGTLLFALALGVARRYEIALLLVGLCFLIHATTSVHVAVMVGVAGLTDRQRWPALLAGIGLFLAAASPLWVSMLAAGSAHPVPWPAPEVWIANTKLTVFFHHYASTFGMRWALLGMPLLILGAAWRMRPHRAVLVYGVVIAALSGGLQGHDGIVFGLRLGLLRHEACRAEGHQGNAGENSSCHSD